MAEDLQRAIEDAETEGWTLAEERTDSAVMVKRKTGSLMTHIIIFIFFGWWTLGGANMLYFLFKYFADKDRKVVRAGE